MDEKDEKKLLKRLNNIEDRLSTIESNLNIIPQEKTNKLSFKESTQSNISTQKSKFPKPEESNESESKSALPDFSFNQIITFLGIVGIVVGIISFFFYAIANNWIGEAAQIGIGVIVGFILFGFAIFLRESNENWSNIVLGGSYFIEYLTIGVGVQSYKVLPDFIGVMLCFVFLVSSIIFSLKFSSRTIAYFSLVGGFMVPLITGMYSNDLFVMIFYILLSLALVIISFYKIWSDLRFSSFVMMSLFLLSFSYKFINTTQIAIPVIFLILIFILYNFSSIIGVIKKEEGISGLDSVILGLLPIIILPLLNLVLKWPKEAFGLLLMFFAFVYMAEMFYFKMNKKTSDISALYTLFSAGLITLNIGLLYILNSINWDYFMVLFVIEWFLFSYLDLISKEDKLLYKNFSYTFLALNIIWYLFVVRFNTYGLAHATFFMFLFIVFISGFMFFARKDLDFKLNAVGFIVGGFFVIYSFFTYLAFFIDSQQVRHIILSIMWLVYTLVIFSNLETKEGKMLVGTLLAITLLKIAYFDLGFLEGALKIIGFILFGVLLLVGGYFVKNDKK